jgi:hypothetical protein
MNAVSPEQAGTGAPYHQAWYAMGNQTHSIKYTARMLKRIRVKTLEIVELEQV